MRQPPPKATSHKAIEALLHQAEEAWGDQDYRKSIDYIEQASRLDPSNPSLPLQVAKAYGMRYDYSSAQHWFARAIRLWPRRAEGLSEAGRAALEFEHLDMAIGYLERAAREKDVSIGALITLADIMIRERRIDTAAELAVQAERVNKNDARVILANARLFRARGETDRSESLLRDLLAKPDTGVAVRIRGLYELADILDRSARYDQAMSTLLEVKALQRPHAAPYIATAQHMRNRAKEMEETITTTVLDRWRGDTDKVDPPHRIALLCGHPRSGTTLLEQVLDAHPDIISADETRMMHDEAYLPLIKDFPEGTSILEALDSVPPSLLNKARDNYFHCTELFTRKSIGGRLLVDKNPALNLMIPMVVRVFPQTRFIVALRDPRDVILSCFMQALPLTPISCNYLSLQSTVTQYASAVGFWLAMRPRMADRWIEVRYEDMVENLPSVARTTLNFLGVDYDEKVLQFDQHARSKRVNSPSHGDVIKPLYRTAIGRWRNYQKYLEPYLPSLEPFLKSLGYD
jgi:tetratricopeptide (TPR) repeat protein